MDPMYVHLPSGAWLAAHHIVSLAIEGSGTEEQERHAVHARMVTGDRQVLTSFQGARSRQEAQQYVTNFLESIGARQLDARP